jgi:hypothetical protein
MRLGKQRVEAKQILIALEDASYGWQNHPAVKMWRNHQGPLAYYGFIITNEWISRGYKDSTLEFFEAIIYNKYFFSHTEIPDWLTDEFCRSHQSNLIRKMPKHYGKLWPNVPNDLPYVWPI